MNARPDLVEMGDSGVRPRIKPIYPRYRVTGTSFRIGAQLGITAEFDDPDGQVWELTRLLDGSRSVPEIAAAMRVRFPALSGADVVAGIMRLDREGFLEDGRPGDAASPAPRHLGNVNYFSHFASLSAHRERPQQRLRAATVVLLGLGGAGSNVLPVLAATGVGRIVALDYDRVDATNLNRQFLYRESDVGSLKTEAAERVMGEMNSSLDFSAVTMKLDSVEDAAGVVAGADLVICAIDEPPFLAQRRVNQSCVEHHVPCIYAVLQVTRGRVFSVLPGESGCFDCLHLHYSKQDPLFVAQFAGFQELEFDPPTLAYAPDIACLSGLIVAEAVRLLAGHAPAQSVATQLEVDFETGAVAPLLHWPRFPLECPTCGAGREEDWPIFAAYDGEAPPVMEVVPLAG